MQRTSEEDGAMGFDTFSFFFSWHTDEPCLHNLKVCLYCTTRNWYTDEPSCGSEACVVMYHQPTANPGLGGPYLYQWNDDRCNMKHNFICKYGPGR